MVANEFSFGKLARLSEATENLSKFLEKVKDNGATLHTFEVGLWHELMNLGHRLMGVFG